MKRFPKNCIVGGNRLVHFTPQCQSLKHHSSVSAVSAALDKASCTSRSFFDYFQLIKYCHVAVLSPYTRIHTHILWPAVVLWQVYFIVLPLVCLTELFQQPAPVWEHILCVCVFSGLMLSSCPCHTPVRPLSETHCKVIKSYWIALSGRLTEPAVTHQSRLHVSDLNSEEVPASEETVDTIVCAFLRFDFHAFAVPVQFEKQITAALLGVTVSS